MLDFIRIATAVPAVCVADVKKNTADICEKIAQADAQKADVLVFPELALTGYTCGDLFFQDGLLKQCMKGLQTIMECSAAHRRVTVVVGTPAILEGQMYNCGAVIGGGRLWGLVPKTYLPNYNEFSERRWFSSAMDLPLSEVSLPQLGMDGEDSVPVGRGLMFRIGDGCMLGVEICEDLWTPLPPATLLAINGAEVIVNLSASSETAGKRAVRDRLVSHQSDVCNCIYAYCSSGYTESTQDLVFSGHSILSECGTKLGENQKQLDSDYLLIRDADLGKVRAARCKNKSVRDAASFFAKVEPARIIDCRCEALRSDGSLYDCEKMPFLPEAPTALEGARSVFEIQVTGLQRRLSLTDMRPILCLREDVDCALALLVCVEAMHRLGRPASDIHGLLSPARDGRVTALAQSLGVRTLSAPSDLRRYAQENNGLIIGCDNMTRWALGSDTYDDAEEMYGVNAALPETLTVWTVQTLARQYPAPQGRLLLDIACAAQEDDPEFGPWIVHDFFLYYMGRYGYAPTKIHALACRAFADAFDGAAIARWLQAFYTRFFSQQSRRNRMPEGVKTVAISLSPRGDWRMPGDACARIWLDEAQSL